MSKLSVPTIVAMCIASGSLPAWSQGRDTLMPLRPVEMSINELAFSELKKGGCHMSATGNANTQCAVQARAWCANHYNDEDQSVAAMIVGADTTHSGWRVAIACLIPKKH
jgi:hypothetical protein